MPTRRGVLGWLAASPAAVLLKGEAKAEKPAVSVRDDRMMTLLAAGSELVSVQYTATGSGPLDLTGPVDVVFQQQLLRTAAENAPHYYPQPPSFIRSWKRVS